MPFRFNPITGELNVVILASSQAVSITFQGDSGSAVPAAGVLQLLGQSLQGITSSASGNTVTFTVADATTLQKGVVELATDAESIAGSLTDNKVINPSSLKAKLGVQTSKGLPYGLGTTAAFSWTNALTDGQVVIGSTAGNPQAASITSTGGDLNITAGSNTLDFALNTVGVAKGGTGSTSFNTKGVVVSGATGTSALTSITLTDGQFVIGSTAGSPAAGTISAGNGVSIVSGSNTITISASGICATSEVTGTSQAMAVNTDYIANNAGLVTLTLPATSAIGDEVSVLYKGAGGWKIDYTTNQQIRVGTSLSTISTGNIASTAAGDCIRLKCITANTLWTAVSVQGNITVV